MRRAKVADRTWLAIVDTGFNGDLELPEAVRREVVLRHIGSVQSNLAAGVTVTEDYFEVRFPFDGRDVIAEATFVDGEEILIGTHLMRSHRLMMDFPQQQVELRRTA